MADSSSLRISEVHRRRRESSARLTLERYREWGMRHVVTKDTVTSVFSLLMVFLAVLRSSDAEGGRDRFLLCASFTMLGLAAQVHVCRAHPEWYRANRVPIVAGLRVFVFLGLVVGWSVTKWNLTRRTYVASRLYLGAFSALGWQLSHPLGLVVQSSVLIMIRLLMYASRGLGHLGVRCSPLAICSFGDVVKPGDSPPSSLFVEQDDGGFALDFSYTRRGFAADVLFVIILPSLLEWIKDEHSKSLFLAEEARMHAAPGIVERRTSRAPPRARRVVQETAAGARPGPIVRAWNWSKRTLPLTEFRDETRAAVRALVPEAPTVGPRAERHDGGVIRHMELAHSRIRALHVPRAEALDRRLLARELHHGVPERVRARAVRSAPRVDRRRVSVVSIRPHALRVVLFALRERHDLREALRVEKRRTRHGGERQERGEMVAVRLAPHPRSGRGLPRGVENGVGAVGGQVRRVHSAPLPQPDVYRRVLALPRSGASSRCAFSS